MILEEKTGGRNEHLELQKIILQKILTSTIILLDAAAANMLGTSRIPIGCMIWQHAFILESIWTTNSITLFIVLLVLLVLLYSCSTLDLYSVFLFGQIILSPISPSPFYSMDKWF